MRDERTGDTGCLTVHPKIWVEESDLYLALFLNEFLPFFLSFCLSIDLLIDRSAVLVFKLVLQADCKENK